jgi:hypothetical protein
VRADVDAHGFPDVMAAIAREAREELGLDVSRDESHLGALGVVEIETDRELGTHILVATALLPQTADEFRPDRDAIDPVEGAWEVGDSAIIVDIRSATHTADAAHMFVAWLRSATQLTAHAVGALLLLVIARQELKQHQANRARAAGMPYDALAWTTNDLAIWLREPPPDDAPEVTDFVRERPLFPI